MQTRFRKCIESDEFTGFLKSNQTFGKVNSSTLVLVHILCLYLLITISVDKCLTRVYILMCTSEKPTSVLITMSMCRRKPFKRVFSSFER